MFATNTSNPICANIFSPTWKTNQKNSSPFPFWWMVSSTQLPLEFYIFSSPESINWRMNIREWSETQEAETSHLLKETRISLKSSCGPIPSKHMDACASDDLRGLGAGNWTQKWGESLYVLLIHEQIRPMVVVDIDRILLYIRCFAISNMVVLMLGALHRLILEEETMLQEGLVPWPASS